MGRVRKIVLMWRIGELKVALQSQVVFQRPAGTVVVQHQPDQAASVPQTTSRITRSSKSTAVPKHRGRVSRSSAFSQRLFIIESFLRERHQCHQTPGSDSGRTGHVIVYSKFSRTCENSQGVSCYCLHDNCSSYKTKRHRCSSFAFI